MEISKEDYIKKKAKSLHEKGLISDEEYEKSLPDHGVIYYFYSDRNGVYDIKKSKVEDVSHNNGFRGDEEVTVTKYYIDESPYDFEFWGDDKYSSNHGFASGFGDLWEWSYYGSFDEDIIKERHKIESKRVREKYTGVKAKLKKHIIEKMEAW